MTTKITPFLWFDRNCEEAMNFYTSVFPNSKIISIHRYPNEGLEGPMQGFEGKVLTAVFELDGQQFMALDGGPYFKPTEAISFYVGCEDQAEVDKYWNALSAHPESEQCGWLKDKYGFSWQITPKRLEELMRDSDKEKVKRVTHAMLEMKKIVIADLELAAQG
jgi:predicted 3-demethylubiquinone-9 3-methyltransferase (glyoxalase superfamily)